MSDQFHRDDLIRMVDLPAAQIEFRADDEGRTLVGVPIVFNRWTEISGWEGNFLERISPTALNRTLQHRGNQVKVLFNHGFDPQIGDKPLGKPTRMDVHEDGLHVEVPLARTSYNDDLIELMRSGALDGMSFRFSVVDEEVDKKPEKSDHNPRAIPERTVRELKLYEFGPVTFPAYEATTVGVRAREAYQAWRTIKNHEPSGPVVDASEDSDDSPQTHLSQQMRDRLVQDEINAAFLTGNPRRVIDEQAETA
jgi:HK97 family phage prohead protease